MKVYFGHNQNVDLTHLPIIFIKNWEFTGEKFIFGWKIDVFETQTIRFHHKWNCTLSNGGFFFWNGQILVMKKNGPYSKIKAFIIYKKNNKYIISLWTCQVETCKIDVTNAKNNKDNNKETRWNERYRFYWELLWPLFVVFFCFYFSYTIKWMMLTTRARFCVSHSLFWVENISRWHSNDSTKWFRCVSMIQLTHVIRKKIPIKLDKM